MSRRAADRISVAGVGFVPAGASRVSASDECSRRFLPAPGDRNGDVSMRSSAANIRASPKAGVDPGLHRRPACRQNRASVFASSVLIARSMQQSRRTRTHCSSHAEPAASSTTNRTRDGAASGGMRQFGSVPRGRSDRRRERNTRAARRVLGRRSARRSPEPTSATAAKPSLAWGISSPGVAIASPERCHEWAAASGGLTMFRRDPSRDLLGEPRV